MSIRYVKMVVNAGDSVLEKRCKKKGDKAETHKGSMGKGRIT